MKGKGKWAKEKGNRNVEGEKREVKGDGEGGGKNGRDKVKGKGEY